VTVESPLNIEPVVVRDQRGTVTATVTLDPEYFAVPPNVALMHQVVTGQLAAARSGTQSTKTRAEVSGGGAKPFKQKGTGRARQGSTRAPHYSGGGIALGPKPRSYRQRTPRKMVQLALRCALSDRAVAGQVIVVENWDFDAPSTKAASAALATLGIEGKALLVLSRADERAYKSFRNMSEIDLVLTGELAAYDVLCSDCVVFTRDTLPGSSSWTSAPVTKAPASRAGAAPAAVVAAPAEPAASEPAASEPAASTPVAGAPEAVESAPDEALDDEAEEA
jgi:large subunit ribosomal protein L4